jgi:hypothetical protein
VIRLIIIFFIFTSCKENKTNFNIDEFSSESFENRINEFYIKVENQDFKGSLIFFSDDFFSDIKKDDFLKKLKDIGLKLGKYKRRKLINSNFFNDNNNEQTLYYQFEYETFYEKGTAKETFTLIKKGNKDIEILGYFILSDAFLK